MPEENKIKIPEHVAIIMDGNRRWARERNLATIDGHRKGYLIMKQAPEWFFAMGVKVVSFFAFSTENWNREREEVNYLMKLLKEAIEDEADEFVKKEIRVLISGRISELPGDLPEAVDSLMNKTKKGTKGILNICLNYGGRAELVDAIKSMVQNKVEVKQIHEGLIKKYLYNGEISDPDIIVRTSGEQRLSGFLLWQSAYSELMFMKKYWPEFERGDAEFIIQEYNQRKRRFGS